MGNARWRRLTEERAGGAKSVFHFDVQGSVAKSTHAGIPWLRFIRQRLGERVHFWPFDGWDIPAGRSAVAEVYPALWSRSFAREDRTAISTMLILPPRGRDLRIWPRVYRMASRSPFAAVRRKSATATNAKGGLCSWAAPEMTGTGTRAGVGARRGQGWKATHPMPAIGTWPPTTARTVHGS